MRTHIRHCLRDEREPCGCGYRQEAWTIHLKKTFGFKRKIREGCVFGRERLPHSVLRGKLG